MMFKSLEVILDTLPALYGGMLITLELLFLSLIGAITLGTFISLVRVSKIKVLSRLAFIYVSYVRSIPLLLVIFWFYFGVPRLIETIIGRSFAIDAFYSCLLAFTMFEAAYFAEIVRAGIESISRGQFLAFRALGMNYIQGMRYIILPQVFRRMLPLMLTQTIILFQDTSLVYSVGLIDFFSAAYSQGQVRGAVPELVLFAGLAYFVLSFGASRLVKRLEKAAF